MTIRAGAFFWMVLLTAFVAGGSSDYDNVRIPEPLQLEMDLPGAWDQTLAVLEKMGYEAQKQEKSEGSIQTREEESIAGVYALSELRKVAVLVTDYQATFHKGKYFLDITVRFLKPRLTTVGVSARIMGLKRRFDGTEEWLTLRSNGVLEMRFLNELSIAATGKRLYDKKLPYWKKSSQEIDIKK